MRDRTVAPHGRTASGRPGESRPARHRREHGGATPHRLHPAHHALDYPRLAGRPEPLRIEVEAPAVVTHGDHGPPALLLGEDRGPAGTSVLADVTKDLPDRGADLLDRRGGQPQGANRRHGHGDLGDFASDLFQGLPKGRPPRRGLRGLPEDQRPEVSLLAGRHLPQTPDLTPGNGLLRPQLPAPLGDERQRLEGGVVDRPGQGLVFRQPGRSLSGLQGLAGGLIGLAAERSRSREATPTAPPARRKVTARWRWPVSDLP
jgi:hypothetical protein